MVFDSYFFLGFKTFVIKSLKAPSIIPPLALPSRRIAILLCRLKHLPGFDVIRADLQHF